MENEYQRDTLISHSILNYLYSCYQGEYAALNTRVKLQIGDVNPDGLKDLDVILSKIYAWYQSLSDGDCLFSAKWKKPETFEASKALEYLKNIKKSLHQEAATMKAALVNIEGNPSAKNVGTLLAGFIRFATGSKHYNEGFLDLSKLLKKPDLAKRYELPNKIAAQEFDLAHRFLAIALKVTDENYSSDLLAALKFSSQRVPGGLRAQVHDLNQMLAQYEPEFTFAIADFTPAEAEVWQALSINPQAAGYWRAYDFSPEEAIEWDSAGIETPAVAALWKISSFTSKEASAWQKEGFNPALARRWADAGYEIQDALKYVKKGFIDPDKLPQGE